MADKLSVKKNIKNYFTSDAWTALSEYEKRRYENVQKNYDILKSSGITPKMPEFIMAKFKRAMATKTTGSDGKSKKNQEQKARFKLFAVPKQPKSKCSDSIKGATSDISVVMETESPSSKTIITTMINLRGVQPKEFASKFLNSAQSSLKILEDMLKGMEKEFPLEAKNDFSLFDKEINLSEPVYSKDIEPKRRYPKRNIAKKCYKEEDAPSEDELLYCEFCNEDHKGACTVHGPMLLICDTKVPKGDPDRAKKTLPYFFSLGHSTLRKAGLGVWTEIPLVPGMMFGPYEGAVIEKNEDAKKSGYAWQVRKHSKTHHYIEAADKSCSNWMRYVNCADLEEWQNVVAIQYLGKIYYKIYKPVLPFTELLTWYGGEYASDLGIELKARKCLQAPKEITGFSCDVCQSLFSSLESLRSHRKTHPRLQHEGRHRCTQCSYSTDHTTHLRNHLLTHSGEKPHACPHCPKRFTRNHDLRWHLLLHTGEKKHACGSCGKRFTHKSNLVRHERLHSGERPYRCPDCGKDFNQVSALKNHRRVHTRQRPYPCPHCEYRSTQSSHLTEHIASQHTRVFPHNCSLCGKGYNRPKELKKHVEKQHSEAEN